LPSTEKHFNIDDKHNFNRGRKLYRVKKNDETFKIKYFEEHDPSIYDCPRYYRGHKNKQHYINKVIPWISPRFSRDEKREFISEYPPMSNLEKEKLK
jgi:hypothetical protein